MNILEVQNMQADMPVLDLNVLVETVKTRKTGEGEYGPWSFQDICVKDSTGEIWVKCQNQDDLDNFRGVEVVLTCYKSDKHGWTGLTTFDNEWEGKITRKLRMTKTGVITTVGGAILSERDVADSPPQVETPKQKWPLTTDSDKLKNRGVAMSYAKDLAVAGTIKIESMEGYANKMYEWMITIPPPEEHTDVEAF